MKRNLTLAAISIFLMFTSCSIVDNLIPDVETTFSHTFLIEITENSGFSSQKILDLESSEDYDDFKKNIKGFEINRITYEISDLNVPEDMYFQGGISCLEPISSDTVTAASIPRTKFTDLPGVLTETDTDLNPASINKLKGWLDDPGSFSYSAFFRLTDPGQQPYNITEIADYSFSIRLKFYVTVLTGL